MIEQLESLIVDLDFSKPRSYLLKGEKGAGKTTFLKTFVHDLVSSGKTCMVIFTENKPEDLTNTVKNQFGWDWDTFINEGKLKLINGCVFSMDTDIDIRNLNRTGYFFENIDESVDIVLFDSLTNILLENELRTVIAFLQKQQERLYSKNIASFFSVETGIFDDKIYNGLAYCFQNIFEFKIKEENNQLKKYFRVFSDGEFRFDSQWRETRLDDEKGLFLTL